MPELKYFEVAFSRTDADDSNAEWICIRGTEQPTLAEANRFLASDVKRLGLPAVGVFPIDENYARSCYDFSHEQDWPIFSKGGNGDVRS